MTMKLSLVRSMAAAFALLGSANLAAAASCGNGAGGFEAWKGRTAEELRGRFGGRAIAALEGTRYNAATIGTM